MLKKNVWRWVLAVTLASLPVVKIVHDWRKDQVLLINNLMYELKFKYLFEMEEREGALVKDQVNQFEKYFRLIVNYLPGHAEAEAMQGFCLYNLGQPQKALKAYQKAIKLNPKFLWFYYDAGMISFKLGDYAQAAQYFQKALLTQPQANLAIVAQSKIFVDILSQSPSPVDVAGRLQQGYALSAFFGQLSAALAQNPGAQKPDIPPGQMQLRMF